MGLGNKKTQQISTQAELAARGTFIFETCQIQSLTKEENESAKRKWVVKFLRGWEPIVYFMTSN